MTKKSPIFLLPGRLREGAAALISAAPLPRAARKGLAMVLAEAAQHIDRLRADYLAELAQAGLIKTRSQLRELRASQAGRANASRPRRTAVKTKVEGEWRRLAGLHISESGRAEIISRTVGLSARRVRQIIRELGLKEKKSGS